MAKIFYGYSTQMASDIGYNDPIPDNYDNDDVLISLIAKYDNHPSILSIKSSLPGHGAFEFKHVDINQIYEILRNIIQFNSSVYSDTLVPYKIIHT